MRRVLAPLVPVLAALAGVLSAIAPGSQFAHMSYLICFSGMVLMGWVRLRALTGPVRTGYPYIVGALTVWVSGDLLYDLLSRTAGPPGEVTPSDVL